MWTLDYVAMGGSLLMVSLLGSIIVVNHADCIFHPLVDISLTCLPIILHADVNISHHLRKRTLSYQQTKAILP